MPLNTSIPRFSRGATVALPFATLPPAFTVIAGNVIHIVAMNARNERALHATLDRDGAVVSQAGEFPISLLAASACRDEAIVAGIYTDKRVHSMLAVDTMGTVRWQTPLPIPTADLVWVLPACIAGEPAVVWEVEKGTIGELCVAALSRGTFARLATSTQQGVAFGLSVAVIGSSIFVLRSRGAQHGGDVLRIESGIVATQAQTLQNAHAIAAVGSRLAVLAWTPHALLLHWLDPTLAPLGTAETIATAEPPSWIRYATLHAADEDRIAISYLVSAAGDLVEMPNRRSEPGTSARHFLGRYDIASAMLVDVTEVQPAGTAWFSGAWSKDRFFFLHGTTSAALSIFELHSA